MGNRIKSFPSVGCAHTKLYNNFSKLVLYPVRGVKIQLNSLSLLFLLSKMCIWTISSTQWLGFMGQLILVLALYAVGWHFS
jgi:hypothetical protein